MAIRKLTNASYLALDWKDEAESKNYLKKGFYSLKIESADVRTLIIKAGSSIDIGGSIYIFDTDTSYDPGIITKNIKFDGTTFANDLNLDIDSYWDPVRLGYYDGDYRYITRFYVNVWHTIVEKSLKNLTAFPLEVSDIRGVMITATVGVNSTSYIGTGVATGNTTNTVVKRGVSGEFSAGAITATSISSPSYTGTGVSTANTANTLVKRDGSGKIDIGSMPTTIVNNNPSSTQLYTQADISALFAEIVNQLNTALGSGTITNPCKT